MKKKIKRSKPYTLITFCLLVIFLSIIILLFGVYKSDINNQNNEIDSITIEEKHNEQIIYDESQLKQIEEELNNKNINNPPLLIKKPSEIKEEKKKKSICIILDDYGYHDTSSILLSLPFKISVSILPNLPFSKKGFELFSSSKNITPMLHIPMQSLNNLVKGENLEIKETDSEEEIYRKLDIFFSEIPAKYANNHMGSRISLNENIVKIILAYLYNKGVRFVDSHTINNSLFVPIGKQMGYPVFENNLFLDYDDEKDLAEKEFRKGLVLLKSRDFIIIIGHNTKPQTLLFLQQLKDKSYFNNYNFISVRELFENY